MNDMTKTKQELVSVVIPVFNVEGYLRRCVGSVLTQSYDNLQVILVDDGSTDSSLRIMEEFAARDGRIRIIAKANSGYGDSMNQGLAAARGEYVGILEPDDIMHPKALEKLVAAAEITLVRPPS